MMFNHHLYQGVIAFAQFWVILKDQETVYIETIVCINYYKQIMVSHIMEWT